MNWYQYFLSIQKYVPSKYPNFVEQMITEFQEGKNEYNDYEYDAHRIADLKAIIMYSGDYNDSIWEIRKLNNYEWPERDFKTWHGKYSIEQFVPSEIYHVVFQDDTEQDFIGLSEVRGNVKSIAVKKMSVSERTIYYLQEIKKDIDEKYMNYLNNLDEEKVIAEIKKYQIPTDTLVCVALGYVYESGVPYDGLHDIDKKIYDHFASMTQQIQIKTVKINTCNNVINVFEPSPYINNEYYEYDEGSYDPEIYTSATCLMIMHRA
jgi:hypothetical protein